MTRQHLKQMAKEQIRGNIFKLLCINLISGILGTLLNISYPTGEYREVFGVLVEVKETLPIGSYLVAPAFTVAILLIFINLTKGIVPQIKDVFSGFRMWWQAVKTNFLVALFTMLWTLLFIIPGIVKSFSYSMSMYIIAENPEMKPLDAIALSKKMMHGHKAESFVLYLSFIGWYFLGIITFGIAFIWIIPYTQATYANYYNYIKSANGMH